MPGKGRYGGNSKYMNDEMPKKKKDMAAHKKAIAMRMKAMEEDKNKDNKDRVNKRKTVGY